MRPGIVGGIAGIAGLFDLDSGPHPAQSVGRITSLRDDALAAQLADVQKHDCAIRLDMLAQLD